MTTTPNYKISVTTQDGELINQFNLADYIESLDSVTSIARSAIMRDVMEAISRHAAAQAEQKSQIKPSHVEIETYQFVMAHGKEPRGRGSWAFFPDQKNQPLESAMWHTGLYSEACKAAKIEAAAKGITTLYLGS